MLKHTDNLSLFDTSAFIKSHTNRPENTDISMMTFITPTPECCGIVKINNWGIVKDFFEKIKNPPGNLANAAVFIIEPRVINYLSDLGKEEIDFSKEVISNYLGCIATFHNDIFHRDIGTKESLFLVHKEFPKRLDNYLRQ